MVKLIPFAAIFCILAESVSKQPEDIIGIEHPL